MNDIQEKRRVLIVDDHTGVLKFLEISLSSREFEVISTTSGKEALDLIKSFVPEIVLLDIVMPGMNGFEVLRNLRNFTDVPVIAFSASPENRDSALLLGANDFVLKPFHPDEMVTKVKAILE